MGLLSSLVVSGMMAGVLVSHVSSPAWMEVGQEAGISPEMAAYCGVSVTQAGTMLDELARRTDLVDAAVQARAQVRSLQAELVALKRNVEHTPAQVEDMSGRIDLATQAVRSSLEAVFDVAVAVAPESARGQMRAWRSSRGTKLPASLRVVEWTAEQMKKLEGAIQAEKQAATRGESLDSASSTLLSDARSRSEVMAATAVQESDLVAMRAVFRARQ